MNRLFKALSYFTGSNPVLYSGVGGSVGAGNGFFAPTTFESGLNNFNAEYRGNDAVFAVVNFLIQKFSSIPLVMYEVRDSKAFNQFKNIKPSTLTHPAAIERYLILRSKALEIAVDSGRAYDIINSPNKQQSFSELMAAMYGHKILSGEGNLYINDGGTKDGTGVPLELYAVPSTFTGLVADPDNVFDVSAYYLSISGNFLYVPKPNLIMWRYFNPVMDVSTRSHLRGVSPLESARDLLEQSRMSRSSMLSMFKTNGARGVLVGKNLPRTLTLPQLQSMIKDVNERINNSNSKGAIAFLNGDWGYHNLGMSSIDLNLLETQRFTLNRVCNIFGVSPILFSTEETSFNNFDTAIRSLIMNKFVPEWVSLRDNLNNKLLKRFKTRYPIYVDFDYTEMPEMQKDLKDLNQSIKDAHHLSWNEKRAVMRYSAREEKQMDYILAPVGYIPIQDIDILGGVTNPIDGSQNEPRNPISGDAG